MALKGPCLSTTMKSTSFCMSFAKTGNWMYPSEYIFSHVKAVRSIMVPFS